MLVVVDEKSEKTMDARPVEQGGLRVGAACGEVRRVYGLAHGQRRGAPYCTSTSRLRSRMYLPSLYFCDGSYALSCEAR